MAGGSTVRPGRGVLRSPQRRKPRGTVPSLSITHTDDGGPRQCAVGSAAPGEHRPRLYRTSEPRWATRAAPTGPATDRARAARPAAGARIRGCGPIGADDLHHAPGAGAGGPVQDQPCAGSAPPHTRRARRFRPCARGYAVACARTHARVRSRTRTGDAALRGADHRGDVRDGPGPAAGRAGGRGSGPDGPGGAVSCLRHVPKGTVRRPRWRAAAWPDLRWIAARLRCGPDRPRICALACCSFFGGNRRARLRAPLLPPACCIDARRPQLLEQYADVFGPGNDDDGDDKGGAGRLGGAKAVGGAGWLGAAMPPAVAALYFEKHHYRALTPADALAARLSYEGHVRALEQGVSGTPPVVDEDEWRRPPPRITCECAPWFTLRYPRSKRAAAGQPPVLGRRTNAKEVGEAQARDTQESLGASGELLQGSSGSLLSLLPGSAKPSSDLHTHFRFFREQQGSGKGAGPPPDEMLRAMFRTKCKEFGVRHNTEQEHGFVMRAQKGLAAEHLRLSDLGVGATALPALAEALAAPDSRATGLDLSNNPLGDAGGAALGRLLPRWGGLQRLDLRSAGLGDAGVLALLEGMRKDTLTHLDLSCCSGALFGRNTVEARGAEAVARLLAQTSSLVWLSLASTGLPPECATVLSKGLRQNLTLRVLNIGDNPMGDNGASNILRAAISADLRELGLERSNISDKSAPHLAALLDAGRVALERLDLRGNKLSSQAASSIASALSFRNTSLTSLVLDGNELGASGASALAKALTLQEWCILDTGRKVEVQMRYPRSLSTLKVAHNEVCDEGASKICTILPKNWTLTTLDLSSNSITDAGARSVGKFVSKNSTLVNLSLAWNLIGDSGISALGQYLRMNQSLENLNIEGNKFSENGGDLIVDMLAACTSLRALNVEYNRITFNHFEAIKSLLEKHAKDSNETSESSQRKEIQRLSQREAQLPGLLQKLKSEERALKTINDAIKEVQAKMQEAKARNITAMSEFETKTSAAIERTKKLQTEIKDFNMKMRQVYIHIYLYIFF